MADADVGKPVAFSDGLPLKSLLGPQPIDWHKVAARLRDEARHAERSTLIPRLGHAELTAIATVMGVCNCLAAAIEDGLS